MKALACLWRGKGVHHADCYDTNYVERLARGVARHVPDGELLIIADEFYADKLKYEVLGFDNLTISLMHGEGCGGWSNMMEAFHPSLWPNDGERQILLGLDTVLLNDCTWLYEWDKCHVGLPLDPYHAPKPCNAVTSYNRDGAALLWYEFLESREDGMKKHLMFGKPSEMMLKRDLYEQYGWYPLEEKPERLLSYKVHVRGGVDWEAATMTYFHGAPKPHELPSNDPVRKAWEAE